MENAFAETVSGYTTVTPQQSNIALSNSSYLYALYPVWLLNTTWRGKQYTFAMNGQTGKLVGDLPCDRAAFWRFVVILTAILAAAGVGISYLWWLL